MVIARCDYNWQLRQVTTLSRVLHYIRAGSIFLGKVFFCEDVRGHLVQVTIQGSKMQWGPAAGTGCYRSPRLAALDSVGDEIQLTVLGGQV